ncbi:unnamed protein product [Polarella glacialis]|uniref:Uncharacterized protein n=1 Tax=Polarella glacialis TaxID=89957 RepID=A0A813J6I1_POLGL|nr:unnamed protein product [Polarella glacialis]
MYVVDPESPDKDIELESADIGAPGLPQGLMKFTMVASPPPQSTITLGGGPLEVAGLYLSAMYRGEEFCRVGYYVRHEHDEPTLAENPPQSVEWSKLVRQLSTPCVTQFLIAWDGPPVALPPADAAAMDDGDD